MTDIPLAPARASADKQLRILENLIERYISVGEEVNYKEAALGDIGNTVASSSLGYWSDVGLITKVKSGTYTPSEAIVRYYKDGFDPTSDSAEAVREILSEHEAYTEALYIIERGDYGEVDEIAKDVISIEDDLSEEDLGDLVRTLETFRLLNLLSPSDQSNGADEESKESERDEMISDDTGGEVDYSSFPFDAEDLPRYSSPESLLTILGVMESGGKWTSDEIKEEDSIDMATRNINGTLDYGVKLGFLDKSEDGYSPTSEGFELYYDQDDEEKVAELFREMVKNYRPYIAILEALYREEGSFEGQETLKNKDIISVLRTQFGYTETSLNTIKRSINSLFKTLEIIGYGERKSGSGLPTRLSFAEGVSLESIVSEICIDSTHSTLSLGRQDSEPEDMEDSEVEGKEGRTTQTAGDTGEERVEGDIDTAESKGVQSRTDETVELSGSKDDFQQEGKEPSKHKSVDIRINVDIDLAELDSAELEAKLSLLQDYLG